MDVNSNITGVYAQPGFHPEARYEIKVHFDGADFEDLTYRVSFGEADASGQQALQLHALTGAGAREDSATGPLVLEGRTGEATSVDGARIWAGRIADPFYIDLSLLAIVNGAVAKGTAVDLSAWQPGQSAEHLRRHQCRVDRAGDPAHPSATAARGADRGLVRHQARHGRGRLAADQPRRAPDDVADLLARRHRLLQPRQHPAPSQDFDAEGKYLADQVAAVVAASGTSGDPQAYGQAVAQRLFPDVLPYVVGTPATFGFAALNGRTQADNAPEAILSLVAGTAVPTGLSLSVTQQQRRKDFPYVVPA